MKHFDTKNAFFPFFLRPLQLRETAGLAKNFKVFCFEISDIFLLRGLGRRRLEGENRAELEQMIRELLPGNAKTESALQETVRSIESCIQNERLVRERTGVRDIVR